MKFNYVEGKKGDKAEKEEKTEKIEKNTKRCCFRKAGQRRKSVYNTSGRNGGSRKEHDCISV